MTELISMKTIQKLFNSCTFAKVMNSWKIKYCVLAKELLVNCLLQFNKMKMKIQLSQNLSIFQK